MSKGKPKLHQLLPVETSLQATFKKVMEETIARLNRRDNFLGYIKRLSMFSENRRPEETQEIKEISEKVPDILSNLNDACIRYFDAYLQKEKTNQLAQADLFVDGILIAEKVPATALLGLESRLKELKRVLESIPVLEPGIKWETVEPSIYTNPTQSERIKTEKTILYKTVAEATLQHPAQVEKWPSDVAVGKYIQTDFSSMMPRHIKTNILNRIDCLIQAVMSARMEANSEEVVPVTIGKNIFDYIYKQ